MFINYTDKLIPQLIITERISYRDIKPLDHYNHDKKILYSIFLIHIRAV